MELILPVYWSPYCSAESRKVVQCAMLRGYMLVQVPNAVQVAQCQRLEYCSIPILHVH